MTLSHSFCNKHPAVLELQPTRTTVGAWLPHHLHTQLPPAPSLQGVRMVPPVSSLALGPWVVWERSVASGTSSMPFLHQRTKPQLQALLQRGACIFIYSVLLGNHLWSKGLMWETRGQTRSGAKARYAVQWGQGSGFEGGLSLAHWGIRYLHIFNELPPNALLVLLNLFHTPRDFTIKRNL